MSLAGLAGLAGTLEMLCLSIEWINHLRTQARLGGTAAVVSQAIAEGGANQFGITGVDIDRRLEQRLRQRGDPAVNKANVSNRDPHSRIDFSVDITFPWLSLTCHQSVRSGMY